VRPGRQLRARLGLAAIVDMAVGYLLKHSLDGAAASLAPVFAIPPRLRIAQLGDRMSDVSVRLAEPGFRDAREAGELRDQIDTFTGETIVQVLDRPAPGQ
jgi:hypothetical protein